MHYIKHFLPGLADLNHLDLNHWFKSWFKSIDFLIKISDLNQYFIIFVKLWKNQSCFGWIIISCSLFWSLLLFLSTLSAPYRSFIPNLDFIIWKYLIYLWFSHNLFKILPCQFLLFERKFVWFLLHIWNCNVIGNVTFLITWCDKCLVMR